MADIEKKSLECHVCKTKFTDPQAYWKHNYEVDCRNPDENDEVHEFYAEKRPFKHSQLHSVASDEQENAKDPIEFKSPGEPYKGVIHSKGSNGVMQFAALNDITNVPQDHASSLNYCNICQIHFPSYNLFLSHQSDDRHLSALRKSILNRISKVDTPTTSGYTISKKSGGSIKTSDIRSRNSSASVSQSGDNRVYCEVCRVYLSSEFKLVEHRNGRKHKSALSKQANSDYSNNDTSTQYSNDAQDVYPNTGYYSHDDQGPVYAQQYSDENGYSHDRYWNYTDGNWPTQQWYAENDDRNYNYVGSDNLPKTSVNEGPLPNNTVDYLPLGNNEIGNDKWNHKMKEIARTLCITQMLSILSADEHEYVVSPTDSVNIKEFISQIHKKCRTELLSLLTSEDCTLQSFADPSQKQSYENESPARTGSVDQNMLLFSCCQQLLLLSLDSVFERGS